MKKKKGFTLVELLAVIVILAVILIIAMPKISEVIKKTRLSSLEATAKLLINQAEKKYTENQVLDNSSAIKCSDVAKLNENDYGTCKIKFDDKGNASVILNGKKDGKFDNLTCSGTKGNLTCGEGQTKVQLKCYTGNETLTGGEEYVNGQYKYYYGDVGVVDNSYNIYYHDIGWKVRLTDEVRQASYENPVVIDTELCTTIDDLPIMSMSHMFDGVKATSIDLSSFDTSNVVDMSGMFLNLETSIIDVSNFDTSNVISMIDMFSMTNLKTIVGLTSFNTSKVVNMSGMFGSSMAADMPSTPGSDDLENVDISSFDTSNVVDMSGMFAGFTCDSCIIGLDKLNTSKVTNMAAMFARVRGTNDTYVFDLSNFNTSKVTDMSNMFYETGSRIIKFGSSFDTSKVTNMSGMFENSYVQNLDLSTFNTSKVTNMSKMFKDMWHFIREDYVDGKWVYKYQKIIFGPNFVTNNVTDMSSMFESAGIDDLDLSKFNTSKVTNMNSMFKYYKGKNLDLSGFDTSNVTNMSNMFYDSKTTTGYAKTCEDATRLNASSNKPSGLTFTVKDTTC